MSELNEMGCDEFADVAAELALGVLTGRERAQAIAHLDHCDACRENVRQLTMTGEELLGLLPASEPPAGFETRVMERIGLAAPGPARVSWISRVRHFGWKPSGRTGQGQRGCFRDCPIPSHGRRGGTAPRGRSRNNRPAASPNLLQLSPR